MTSHHDAHPGGRQLQTLEAIRQQLKHHTPRLKFDPQFSPQEHAAWRQNVVGELREIMLLLDMPTAAPRQLWEEPRDGYRLQKWEFSPDAFTVLPVLMLIPDTATTENPAPLVLCFPGSDHTKERLAGESEPPGSNPFNRNPEANCMALHYARQGYIALAIDHPTMGETGSETDPNRSLTAWHLIWMGTSYEALSVSQKWHVLQWARQLPQVDKTRIATSGHSLGAKPALILGLLSDDVSAVVYNDLMASWQERQVATGMKLRGWWHAVPGLLQWFDYTDLKFALAPKPLLISEGGRTVYLEALQQLYHAQGAPDAFQFNYYPEYADSKNRLYDDKPIPEGIDDATFLRYCNVNPDGHWFKAGVVLPWLTKIWGR